MFYSYILSLTERRLRKKLIFTTFCLARTWRLGCMGNLWGRMVVPVLSSTLFCSVLEAVFFRVYFDSFAQVSIFLFCQCSFLLGSSVFISSYLFPIFVHLLCLLSKFLHLIRQIRISLFTIVSYTKSPCNVAFVL